MRPFPVRAVAEALQAAGLLLEVSGEVPETAVDLTEDSRSVRPGGMFVALQGTQRDGHDFLEAAQQAGASLALVEQAERTALPYLRVSQGRRAAGVAAAAAFGWPGRLLYLAGVTGTNGKTTTVGIVRHLLDDAASLGTLGLVVGSPGQLLPGGGGLTTPGPVELQRVLRRMVDQGVRHLAMEVSSHSLDQHRVEGLQFEVAVFTNLTRDHLDYHGSLEAYFAAKALLLNQLTPTGVSVVNADDPAWANLPPGPRRTFGLEREADFRARQASFGPRGSQFSMEWSGRCYPVQLPLIGSFNVSNALAAAATACLLGVTPEQVAERLGRVPQVPGRLELLSHSPTVLRDYAHTPDALMRALEAVRPFTPGRLILVFGCGGERDRGKRPLMARAAAAADQIIITSDNPRGEDPELILDEIEAGFPPGAMWQRREDRRQAIASALSLAGPGDMVVLAGKGHEDYQIRGSEKLPFDEKVIVAELLALQEERAAEPKQQLP